MAAAFLLLAGVASAVDVDFLSASCCTGGKAWTDTSCWNGGVLPGAADRAIFTGTSNFVSTTCDVSLSSVETIKGIKLEGRMVLTVTGASPSGSQIVTETLEVADGQGKFTADMIAVVVSGTACPILGTLESKNAAIVGAGSIQLSGSAAYLNILQDVGEESEFNLAVSSGSTDSIIEITGTEFTMSGTISTSGRITVDVQEEIFSAGGAWTLSSPDSTLEILGSTTGASVIGPAINVDGTSVTLNHDYKARLRGGGTGSGRWTSFSGGILTFEKGYSFGSDTDFYGPGLIEIKQAAAPLDFNIGGTLQTGSILQISDTIHISSALVVKSSLIFAEDAGTAVAPALTGNGMTSTEIIEVTGTGSITRAGTTQLISMSDVLIRVNAGGVLSLDKAKLTDVMIVNEGSASLSSVIYEYSAAPSSDPADNPHIINIGTMIVSDPTFYLSASVLDKTSPDVMTEPSASHELLMMINNQAPGTVAISGSLCDASISAEFGQGSSNITAAEIGDGFFAFWGTAVEPYVPDPVNNPDIVESRRAVLVRLLLSADAASKPTLSAIRVPFSIEPGFPINGDLSVAWSDVQCPSECTVSVGAQLIIVQSSKVGGVGPFRNDGSVSFEAGASAG